MRHREGRRVLMLLQNSPFPQDRRVWPEANALAQAGYRVTVIAPAAPGQSWRENVEGVTAYRYPASPVLGGAAGFVLEYGWSLLATLVLSLVVFVRHGFDAVHAHNPPDLFVFIAALYRPFGVRFVFDHHDLAPELYRAKFGPGSSPAVYRVLMWLERLSCRLADRVIVTNESCMVIAEQRCAVPRRRITVVRNGPDLDIVRRVEPDPGLLDRRKAIIGYVGVMGSQDGLDYLLRALACLAHEMRRTDFFCVLIGGGDAWPGLRRQASELNLDPYVMFTGLLPTARVLPLLSAATICVDPGPSNAYNDASTTIKLMEYMALEKPIVAFDLPEHRVTARDAARYVTPNDEREFARALADLMDDPVRRDAMGAIGRRRVESELAWSYSVPHLLGAYRALFHDPSSAARTGLAPLASELPGRTGGPEA